MSKQIILRRDIYPEGTEEVGGFDHYHEAMQEAVRLFDDGCDDNFHIVDNRENRMYLISSHTMQLDTCPVCGREVRRYQMERTHDCHGIPFRMVCGRCFDRIMDYPGYDGEKYDEADENLDYDY